MIRKLRKTWMLLDVLKHTRDPDVASLANSVRKQASALQSLDHAWNGGYNKELREELDRVRSFSEWAPRFLKSHPGSRIFGLNVSEGGGSIRCVTGWI